MAVVLTRAFAFANAWTGTITETITSTTDPHYTVGQVFTGSYQYLSDTADGTFAVARPGSTAANATLTGTLFEGFSGLDPIQAAPYADNRLIVNHGVVTGFLYQDQSGGNEWIGGAGPSTPFRFQFDLMSGPEGGTYSILGTIAFSDPVDPPSSVPDSGSTALLTAAGLLFLGFLRPARLMK